MSEQDQMEVPTVLMVEDEEDTATLIKFVLEREGYRVVHAVDGQKAKTFIDEMDSPQLVLLDIMLPFLNGLKLVSYIRQKTGWQSVPILMLTADSSERDIQQALETGANDYMVKPFNPRELVARLQRCLRVSV